MNISPPLTHMVKPFKAGVLLSRTPIVTPRPSAFAAAYYKYMGELERRLMWTFPSFFYFKRGTLAQRKFNDLQTGPVPRHKDVYFPRGLPDVHFNRDRRFKETVKIVPDEQEKVRQQPRETGDEQTTTSLARKLDQTLYLLVKDKEWRLPAYDVDDAVPSLHEAAEAGLRSAGGELMNLWTVSNTPAAVLKSNEVPEFVIKLHILHGQFQPAKGEFAWLTKDEIKEKVSPKYFEEVEALL